MTWRVLLAASALAIGVMLTVANLRDGLQFSWPLVLGLLLIADGVLRLMALPDERA